MQQTLLGATAAKQELERRYRDLEASSRDTELRYTTMSNALHTTQMQLSAVESRCTALFHELEQTRTRTEEQDARLKELQSTVLARDAQIGMLRAQNISLQKSLARNARPPGVQEFEELEAMVAEVEMRYKTMLAEREAAAAELRRRYERELAAKNTQVGFFRQELAQLIGTVESRLGGGGGSVSSAEPHAATTRV